MIDTYVWFDFLDGWIVTRGYHVCVYMRTQYAMVNTYLLHYSLFGVYAIIAIIFHRYMTYSFIYVLTPRVIHVPPMYLLQCSLDGM